MYPGVNCDCMRGETDYCDACELEVEDCPCWKEDEDE